MNLKDKLMGTWGTLGLIIGWIISIVISVLPWIIMPVGYVGSILGVVICFFFPMLKIPAWLVALYFVITGPQDFWAILYYVIAISFVLDFIRNWLKN